MQRGIIDFNRDEASLALLLAENTTADLTSLRAKLQLAANGVAEQVRLEVNRDEVETLLDAFPGPTPNQPKSFFSLRDKLGMFLANGS